MLPLDFSPLTASLPIVEANSTSLIASLPQASQSGFEEHLQRAHQPASKTTAVEPQPAAADRNEYASQKQSAPPAELAQEPPPPAAAEGPGHRPDAPEDGHADRESPPGPSRSPTETEPAVAGSEAAVELHTDVDQTQVNLAAALILPSTEASTADAEPIEQAAQQPEGLPADALDSVSSTKDTQSSRPRLFAAGPANAGRPVKDRPAMRTQASEPHRVEAETFQAKGNTPGEAVVALDETGIAAQADGPKVPVRRTAGNRTERPNNSKGSNSAEPKPAARIARPAADGDLRIQSFGTQRAGAAHEARSIDSTAAAAGGRIASSSSAVAAEAASSALSAADLSGIENATEPGHGEPEPRPAQIDRPADHQPGTDARGLGRLSQHVSSRIESHSPALGNTPEVDRVRLIQRVARALHSAGDRGGVLRLRLSPPELGSLTLDITVRQGLLSARVTAETSTARTLLLDGLPELRDRLAQQEMRIEQFEVALRDESPGGLPQNPGRGWDAEGFRHPSGSTRRSPAPAAASMGAQSGPSGRAPGVDQLNVVV